MIRRQISKIIIFFKKHKLISHWNKLNPDSYCEPNSLFDVSIVKSGKYSYGDLNVISFNNANHLYIGSFCSIAQDAYFLLNAEHSIIFVSSYPFDAVLNKKEEASSKGDIIVDDDVWIGYRATILSGVHIGQGAVIAAGAVVTKDIPPYAIVGGVPAKVIKYRFSQDVIDVLMTIDYSKLSKDLITAHTDDLYKPLDGLSVEEVEEVIAWMPKKEPKNTQF